MIYDEMFCKISECMGSRANCVTKIMWNVLGPEWDGL